MDTQLKTVDIKGKKYVEVSERIRYFRESQEFKEWSIETNIIEINEERVIMKTFIKNSEQIVKSTGVAYEKEGSSFINKTSYIENCETSSVGRALGMLGIGIKGNVASAEEVNNAIKQQGDIEQLQTIKKAKKANTTPPQQQVNTQNIKITMATAAQGKKIFQIVGMLKWTEQYRKEFMMKEYKISSSKELTKKDAMDWINKLEIMIQERAEGNDE